MVHMLSARQMELSFVSDVPGYSCGVKRAHDRVQSCRLVSNMQLRFALQIGGAALAY